jgi:predicted RNase H-like HicB family nuclease
MSETTTRTYTAEVHHEDDGSYWAAVRELPGCFASGFSLDELRESLEEAICVYEDDDPSSGKITHFEKQEHAGSLEVGEMKVLVGA